MLTRDKLTECRLIDSKWWLIGGFTLIHFLATMTCLLVSVGAGLSHFDTGAAETLLERVTSVGANVLMFPMYYLTSTNWVASLGKFQNLLVIANSLFWAVCFYGVLRVILKRRIMAQA